MSGTVVRSVGTAITNAPIAKKSTCVLSDGTIVAAVWDWNQAGVTGDGGDGTGTPKLYIYTSTDGCQTWTLRTTTTVSFSAGYTNVSICTDSSDNLHTAYRSSTGAIIYNKHTRSGSTWTVGGNETVAAAPTPANQYRRVEIDICNGTQPIIAAWGIQSNNNSYIYSFCRTTAPAWVAATPFAFIGTGKVPLYADISIACSTTLTSGVGCALIMVTRKCADGTDYGDILLAQRFTMSTGAQASINNQFAAPVNVGGGGGQRRYWLFSTGTNEYTCIGLVGNTNVGIYVHRFTTTGTVNGAVTSTLIPAHNIATTKSFESLAAYNSSACVMGPTSATIIGGTGGKTITLKITRSPDAAVLSTFQGVWDFENSNSSKGVLAWFSGGNNQNLNLNIQPALSFNYALNAHYDTYGWYNAPARSPSAVIPQDGSNLATDLPTLAGTFELESDSPQARVKMRWQLAKDAGFTTSLIDITQLDTEYISPFGTLTPPVFTSGAIPVGVPVRGTTSAVHTLSALEAITEGTWYVRAASIDETGQQGAWSSAQSFLDSHPGTVYNPAPTNNQVFEYGTGDVTFSWLTSFVTGDYQTAYEIIVEVADTGSVVVDSGKVASIVMPTIRNGVPFPRSSLGVQNIPSGDKDLQLRWKVRVWDKEDFPGPYSDYQTFYVADPAVVVITSPAEGDTIDTGNPTITWTFTAGGTRTQATYCVGIFQAGVMVYLSPVFTGTGTSVDIPVGYLDNTSTYTVEMFIVDSAGLPAFDSNTFFTAWTPPAAPNFGVSNTDYNVDGKLEVTWIDDTIDADFVQYNVYRRVHNDDSTKVLLDSENVIQSTYSYDDYHAASLTEYDYTVTQIANRFGSIVESVPVWTSVTGTSETYWLLHPTDPTKNLVLRNVVDDSFTDEYQMETYNVIGRGQHVDYGDRLGYAGSLSAQFRDVVGLSARTQRLALEALKAEKSTLFLRTPFGDIFTVAAGNIGIKRIAGMGTSEGVDVSIPYQEVGF